MIADGRVDVRAYLKDRMHAKAHIGYTGLESAPGTAIIGSTFRSTLEVLMESNRQFRSVILNGRVSQDEGEQDSEEALTVDLPGGEELDTDELDRDEEYIRIKD